MNKQITFCLPRSCGLNKNILQLNKYISKGDSYPPTQTSLIEDYRSTIGYTLMGEQFVISPFKKEIHSKCIQYSFSIYERKLLIRTETHLKCEVKNL